MAHPSSLLPSDIYVLNGENDLSLANARYVVAIYNPTAGEVTVDLTGAINTYSASDSDYKLSTSEVTGIPIPAGGTLYGRFTNVGCETENVICYIN